MEAAEAEKVAAELKAQSMALAAETVKVEAIPASPETTMHVNVTVEGDVDNSDTDVPDVPRARDAVEQAQAADTVTSLATVEEGEQSSALADVPDILPAGTVVEPVDVANTATSPPTVEGPDHTSALVTETEDSGPPVVPLESTTNEPSSPITNIHATLPSPVSTKIEACPTTKDQHSIDSDTYFAHADVDLTCVGRKRSGLSDSGSSGSDSDFVEI